MNILITQRHIKNKHGQWADSLENNYLAYFKSFGVYLIPVPNTVRIQDILKIYDFSHIILGGGGDVNPQLYNQKPDSELEISSKRDALEAELIQLSIKKQIPLMGICRGMQFINVYFGGELIQDLSRIDKRKKHSPPCSHLIKIKNSKIIKALDADQIKTNSFHNQIISLNKLAKNLKCFAIAEDISIVEGLYHPQYPIAGIQWHPERPGSAKKLDKLLIHSFLTKKLFWKKDV